VAAARRPIGVAAIEARSLPIAFARRVHPTAGPRRERLRGRSAAPGTPSRQRWPGGGQRAKMRRLVALERPAGHRMTKQRLAGSAQWRWSRAAVHDPTGVTEAVRGSSRGLEGAFSSTARQGRRSGRRCLGSTRAVAMVSMRTAMAAEARLCVLAPTSALRAAQSEPQPPRLAPPAPVIPPSRLSGRSPPAGAAVPSAEARSRHWRRVPGRQAPCSAPGCSVADVQCDRCLRG